MKKRIIVAIYMLFLASVILCTVLGEEIRDAFSPTVEFAYPEYAVISSGDQHAYPSFSASAVLCDGDGQNYVFAVIPTNEYPEDAYKVTREDITVLHQDDGFVYVQFQNSEMHGAVAISWSRELRDGQRVKVNT